MSIVLGSKVTDVLTGFTGTAISRTQYEHGCVHISIQPVALKEGLPADAIYLNELRLVENDLTTEQPPLSPLLGTIGTDSVTGMTGTIVSYTEYLYQSPRVFLQPKGMTDEGKPLDGIAIDEVQLEKHVPEKTKAKSKVAGPGQVPQPMAAPRR